MVDPQPAIMVEKMRQPLDLVAHGRGGKNIATPDSAAAVGNAP